MSDKVKNNRGLIIFVAIVLVFIAVGLAAYLTSGNKGIEERFSQAVGLGSAPEEGGPGGFLGFNVEGNLITYVIILLALIVVCVVLLKVFKI
jgi:Kef-type K+ transport system membrane component KefB